MPFLPDAGLPMWAGRFPVGSTMPVPDRVRPPSWVMYLFVFFAVSR